jgi:hypothetical protein
MNVVLCIGAKNLELDPCIVIYCHVVSHTTTYQVNSLEIVMTLFRGVLGHHLITPVRNIDNIVNLRVQSRYKRRIIIWTHKVGISLIEGVMKTHILVKYTQQTPSSERAP